MGDEHKTQILEKCKAVGLLLMPYLQEEFKGWLPDLLPQLAASIAVDAVQKIEQFKHEAHSL